MATKNFRMVNSGEQRAQFILPDDQPLVRLEVKQAFSALTTSESLYSHYLSRAAWYVHKHKQFT